MSSRKLRRDGKDPGSPRDEKRPNYPNFNLEQKKERENRDEEMEAYSTPPNKRDYLGIVTLVLLGSAGIAGAVTYHDKPYWVQVPYYATIVGSWGGVLWEAFGNLNGRWAETVTSMRSANVGIVAGSILYLFFRLSGYTCLTKSQAMFLVSTIGSLLFSNSYLGHGRTRGALTSVLVFVTCILLAAFPSAQPLITKPHHYYMIGFAVSLLLAFFSLNVPDPRHPKPDPNVQYSAPPPPNLALFHFVNAIGSFLSIYGLKNLTIPSSEATDCCKWTSVLFGILLGSGLNFFKNPLAVSAFLNIISGFVWNLILRKLLKQQPWEPTPLPPFKPSEKIITKPYYETHPHTRPLSCPSAVSIPVDQQKDFKAIKFLFGLISILDRILPRARLVPLKNKPRLLKKQLNQYYWNSVLIQNVVPITTTPKKAREYFNRGQFLEYIVWFAHASNMLRKTDGKEAKYGTHVLDFEYLNKYQYKPDYQPYGGKAFFKLEGKEARLDVTGVMAPGSDIFIHKPDYSSPEKPDDWRFRQIESIISAAAFYEVVVGLHLLGIHVMMNTVPIALHNAFDLAPFRGSGYHPYRVALNLHFFNHIFVNELTTAHLLAETSVFPQIFATTHSGLCDYLNDKYLEFEYAKDAKLEERCAVVDNQFPETSQLAVEGKLVEIFRLYGKEVVDAIYKNDREVADDSAIQKLKTEMNKLVRKGLPDRFDFQTKEGIARFFSESAYIVTVRHEVYGTKATFPGLDPSIMNGQIPRDFGPDAIDAYNSTLWVGLATAQARFAHLQQDYRKLLAPIENDIIRLGIVKAYDNFQFRLGELQASEEYDYAHLRVLPIHLETGAGY